MSIVITGGSGFLGVSVAERLLDMIAAGTLDEQLILTDLFEHPRLDRIRDRVEFRQGDLTDRAFVNALISPDTSAVFHFASLVSGGAEKDFAAGLDANVLAPQYLLEACRLQSNCPKWIFPSSIATFGGDTLPKIIDDYTHQHPQNSYGVAKVVIEQLLNDYTRKGFVDGRGVRLPAIIVRDEPNTAASGYASGIIREAAVGNNYVCPVSAETRLPVLSIARCIDLMIDLWQVDGAKLGDYRTVNGPGLAPSAAEITAAVNVVVGDQAGVVSYQPDEAVMQIVATWPQEMRYDRAAAAGLRADESVEQIVREYLASLEV